jgi:hypothetical protein
LKLLIDCRAEVGFNPIAERCNLRGGDRIEARRA